MARSRRGGGSAWANARRTENEYRRHLRRIAANIDHIVRSMVGDDPGVVRAIEEILEEYARILDPWARAVAARMIEDVARRDANAYFAHAREMGLELRHLIETTPTGLIVQRLMDEQVHLIKSLPLDAARRVHEEAIGGLSQGTRWEDIARSILQTGEVTRGRANLIARTETGHRLGLGPLRHLKPWAI